MTDIYTAIMKAADHIETYPELFHFMEAKVPHSCGTFGCALGWIGHFAGEPARTEEPGRYCYRDVARGHLGMAQQDFYDRMSDMEGVHDWSWTSNATKCARRLRMYARKYHAPIPEAVLNIFKPGAIERQLESIQTESYRTEEVK